MFRRMVGVWLLALAVALVAVAPGTYAGAAAKAAGAMAGSEMAQAKVNLNSADALQLASLPGIGEVTAQAIVDYRDKNGPFQKVEDLMQVKGIGEKKMEALRDLVVLK